MDDSVRAGEIAPPSARGDELARGDEVAQQLQKLGAQVIDAATDKAVTIEELQRHVEALCRAAYREKMNHYIDARDPWTTRANTAAPANKQAAPAGQTANREAMTNR